MKITIKVLLSCLLALSLFGCNNSIKDDTEKNAEEVKIDLSDYPHIETVAVDSFYESSKEKKDWGIYLNWYENKTANEAFRRYRDFSKRFLLNSIERGENEIISPLSAYYAMAILANGADNDSRLQLENALGMSADDLNEFLSDLDLSSMGYGDERHYVKTNSLWFNTHEGLYLKDEFKTVINEFYGDCTGEYDFKDGSGLAEAVNKWTSDNTKGAITNMVEPGDFNEKTSFIILNALAAGDKWDMPFDTSKTYLQEFHSYDGSIGMTEMMHDTLSGHWSDDLSEGFSKRLQNGLMFIGILPNEGIDVYDYLNQMSDSTFGKYAQMYTLYGNEEPSPDGWGCIADYHYTNLSFPKLNFEKEYDLKETFLKMGLKDLFDPATADMNAMAQGDQKAIDQLYVDKIKQKCSIEVDEEKAVASAITMVAGGLGGDGCAVRQEIYHDVVFDRPFVIAMTDYSENMTMPLFIGVVSKLGEPLEGGFRIENITGKINIRKGPSKNTDKDGYFEKGQVFYAFEKTTAEGYTWYRIGTDRWVADKNGEWIKELD